MYSILYDTQYVGRWVAMLNSVLRIGIVAKCVRIYESQEVQNKNINRNH